MQILSFPWLRRSRAAVFCLLSPLVLAAPGWTMAAVEEDRQRAAQLFEDGNFQEAYDLYRSLLTGPEHGGAAAEQDLQRAWECVQRLWNLGAIDALLEETIAAHPDDWRVLRGAAQVYRQLPDYGMEIEGSFRRGCGESGSRVLYSEARDRVRALQLLDRARGLVADDPDRADAAALLQRMVETLQENRPYWRLQEKTDLSELPEYALQPEYGWGDDPGAPVDASGEPVFFAVPESWESAESDGARMRWLLLEISETHAPLAGWVEFYIASNLFQPVFGVQTLATYGYRPRDPSEDAGEDRSAILALHTLEENETVCRLATGV
ncbi:MAG TPA: hypothetical protein VMN36_03975 [Verrucomicrobiales bacterium]|nr:hypothetical protein [Verrucomicrobiales bacterium]